MKIKNIKFTWIFLSLIFFLLPTGILASELSGKLLMIIEDNFEEGHARELFYLETSEQGLVKLEILDNQYKNNLDQKFLNQTIKVHTSGQNADGAFRVVMIEKPKSNGLVNFSSTSNSNTFSNSLCDIGERCPRKKAYILVSIMGSSGTPISPPLTVAQMQSKAQEIKNLFESNTKARYTLTGMNGTGAGDIYETTITLPAGLSGCALAEKKALVLAALNSQYPAIQFEEYEMFQMIPYTTGCSSSVGFLCSPGSLSVIFSQTMAHEDGHNLCHHHSKKALSSCFDELGFSFDHFINGSCDIQEYKPGVLMGTGWNLNSTQADGQNYHAPGQVMEFDPRASGAQTFTLENHLIANSNHLQTLKISHPEMSNYGLGFYVYFNSSSKIIVDVGGFLTIYSLEVAELGMGQTYRDEHAGVEITHLGNGQVRIAPTSGTSGPPLGVQASQGSFVDKVRVTWLPPDSPPLSYKVFRNSNCSGGAIGSDLVDLTFDDLQPLINQINIYTVETVYTHESHCSTPVRGWLPRQ